MGGSRTVLGVLAPYTARVFVWEGEDVGSGGSVGPLGMADTYAVKLDGPSGRPDRFAWVQECVLTNVMAHQPIEGASVFDARGRYLGRGGESLAAGNSPPLPVPTGSSVPRPNEPVRYVFPLRRGVLVTLSLPADLSHREAERLGAFVQLLSTES